LIDPLGLLLEIFGDIHDWFGFTEFRRGLNHRSCFRLGVFLWI
jgi:hypothetical protein